MQGNDNILDLVKLVQPAALIPLMNAEIESSGDLRASYNWSAALNHWDGVGVTHKLTFSCAC